MIFHLYTDSLMSRIWADVVGQASSLRPIVNRPLVAFASSQGGRLTIDRRLPACPTIYFVFCCFLICWTMWAAVRSKTSDAARPGFSYADQITARDFRSTRKIVPRPCPKVEIRAAGFSLLSLSVSLDSAGGKRSTSFC